MAKESQNNDGHTHHPDLLESFSNTLTGVDKEVTHTTDDGTVGYGHTAEEARRDAENKSK